MIITIKKIGKMFEIKGIFKESIITRYAKAGNINARVCEVCNVL